MDEWVLLPNVVVEQPAASWEEFQAVQSRLRLNKLNSQRNTRNEYLLRGFIHCETHHTRYRGRRQRGRNANVYLCTGYYGKAVQIGPCARTSIGGMTLEREVWERAVSLLSDPQTILDELERRRATREETGENIRELVKGVEQRLRRGEDDEMKLSTSWLRLGMSESVYQRQLALIKAERSWCTEERDRLNHQLAAVRQRFATIEQVEQLRERIGDKLVNAAFKDKRFVLEALDTRIAVAKNGSMRLSFTVPMPQGCTVLGTSRTSWPRARTTTPS
jgi:AMMECR1 domain-containing protein